MSVCVKDETRMLLFSMIWHLLLGADHYYICDNSASRNLSIERALKPFIGTGLVTIKKVSNSSTSDESKKVYVSKVEQCRIIPLLAVC